MTSQETSSKLVAMLEVPGIKSESREASPYRGAEIVIERIENLEEILEMFLTPGRQEGSNMFEVPVRDGKATRFTGSFGEIFQAVIKSENIVEGTIRVIIRKDIVQPDMTVDDWHIEGETIYVYANIFPTEILRDAEGAYAKLVNARGYFIGTLQPEDVWRPPNEALVRIPGDVIHRRPSQALHPTGRYLLRITLSRSVRG